MFKKWGILLIVLATAVGFGLFETNKALGETIDHKEIINPNAKESFADALEFKFEILNPNQTTPVDGYSIFLYKLTNLSSSERITPEDLVSAHVSFEPALPLAYFDWLGWILMGFSWFRIFLEPGESTVGYFTRINWSDEVPVGYVQTGEMGVTIGDEYQGVSYSVTITE